MAWTAKVADKTYVNGALRVSVEYSNGVDQKFTESVDVTGGDLEIAKAKVRARLNTLVATDDLDSKIVIGANMKSNAPAATAVETFLAALKHFRSCKNAVVVGLMQETDAAYVDAQAALITAYDPAFLDLI